MKMEVQLAQVLNAGHRRRPLSLKILHPLLDSGLLRRCFGHAESRREVVVTGQCRVAWVESTIATLENVGGHGLGIIPPQFARYAAKERECLDEPLENGLGAFGGEGQCEWAVGVAPGDNQDRDLTTELGEVHVDVSEVGFDSMARRVFERDEGLAAFEAMLLHIALDRMIAASVAVFADETAIELLGGVSLLEWGGPILFEDLVNNRSELVKDGSGTWLRQGIRLGLGLAQYLENGLRGMSKSFGELADGKTISPGLSDLCEVVHREHPPPPWATTWSLVGVVLRCFPFRCSLRFPFRC